MITSEAGAKGTAAIVATTLELTPRWVPPANNEASLRRALRIPSRVYLRESSLAPGQNWRSNKIGSNG